MADRSLSLIQDVYKRQAQLLLLGQYCEERLHSFMFAHPTLDEILRSALEAPRQTIG